MGNGLEQSTIIPIPGNRHVNSQNLWVRFVQWTALELRQGNNSLHHYTVGFHLRRCFWYVFGLQIPPHKVFGEDIYIYIYIHIIALHGVHGIWYTFLQTPRLYLLIWKTHMSCPTAHCTRTKSASRSCFSCNFQTLAFSFEQVFRLCHQKKWPQMGSPCFIHVEEESSNRVA